MNIKEIKEYSRSAHNDILSIARSIHPKLFSILQYSDLLDNSLRDGNLKVLYDSQIRDAKQKYCNDLRKMKCDYLSQFFADYMELGTFDDYGINLDTGAWMDNPTEWMKVSFLPRSEVQPIYDGVLDIHLDKTRIEPFWNRGGYTISSVHEKVTVKGWGDPVGFIDYHRGLFRNGVRNKVYDLLDSAKLANTFDYHIHLEPLNEYEERQIAQHYMIKGVERHAKLRDFLESSIDKNLDYYTSTMKNSRYTFRGPCGEN